MECGIRVFGGRRFFPETIQELERFIDRAKDLPSNYFTEKFQELQDIPSPQRRGRLFNYFVGLLFQQLPGVDVLVGKSVATGEIDVFIACLDSPEWLVRLVGSVTAVENKWEDEPIQPREIETFHSKTRYIPVECKLCYFVSMSGFTSQRDIGGQQSILEKSNPSIIAWEEGDLRRAIMDGTPENVMRKRLMK